jgi:hypothetical protein
MYLVLISVVSEHRHYTLVGDNHVRERWPAINVHRLRGRDV